MKRTDFRFLERLRVRWAEIDAQKIVFNGHYLMYFDTAIAGYWRALAMPYAQTMDYLGGDLYVRKATVEYESSAHYDDVLDVGIRTMRIGNSSIFFQCGCFRQDELLVSCELVYVFADPATQTSKPVPQQLRDMLQAFEAGYLEALCLVNTALDSQDNQRRGAEVCAATLALYGIREGQPWRGHPDWDRLEPARLQDVETVGLASGLSTPREVVEAVQARLLAECGAMLGETR